MNPVRLGCRKDGALDSHHRSPRLKRREGTADPGSWVNFRLAGGGAVRFNAGRQAWSGSVRPNGSLRHRERSTPTHEGGSTMKFLMAAATAAAVVAFAAPAWADTGTDARLAQVEQRLSEQAASSALEIQ